MVKVGALWLKKTKKGQTMMSGEVNGAKVMIFKNGFKQQGKHPDYVVYDGSRDNENTENAALPVAEDKKETKAKSKSKAKDEPSKDAATDDDVPF